MTGGAAVLEIRRPLPIAGSANTLVQSIRLLAPALMHSV